MRKNKLKYVFILLTLCVVNFFIYTIIDVDFKFDVTLSFDIKADVNDQYQVFYLTDANDNWGDDNKFVSVDYTNAGKEQNVEIPLPKDVKYIRIDPGNGFSSVCISNLEIKNGVESVTLIDKNEVLSPQHDISGFNIDAENQKVDIAVSGNDPFFLIDLKDINVAEIDTVSAALNNILKIATCIVASIFVILIGLRMGFVYSFIKGLFEDRKLIWRLSKNDFKTKYAGSFFGIVWAFVQPVVTVLVYWFVFQIGLKATNVEGCPFVLWFVSGLVPWFFFSDALTNGTNSLFEYSYLVKKVVFKISIIPIVKIISALFVHLFFICFMLLLFAGYGYYPNAYTVQIIYYTFALFVFSLGLVYATCAIVLFFKDLGQIITILLQIGMWMTPIMWSYTIIQEKYRIFFKLNPIFYIVEGYRDSLIDGFWFWQRANYSIYFWIITLGIFGFGTIIFRKLKVHFADVL